MKLAIMIFSSRQIPQLKQLSVTESAKIIYEARTRFTPIQVISLNIMKLLLLTPIFFFIARSQITYTIIAALIAVICYFTVYRALFFRFVVSYLDRKK
jgi:type IV secretory pathway VirB3-like protein